MTEITPIQKLELAEQLILVLDNYLAEHNLSSYEGNQALLIAFFARASEFQLAEYPMLRPS